MTDRAAPALVVARGRVRLAGLDRLRGLAILLMVADHTLVATRADGAWMAARLFGTQAASLPLFCLVAGSLARGRSRRIVRVLAAGAAATFLGAPIGIGQPDVLLVLGLVLLAMAGMTARAQPAVLVVAVMQPALWPMGTGAWEPGIVLALLIAGRLWGADHLDRIGGRLPAGRALGWVGRYPLTWYLGHLAVLYGAWILWLR